MWKEEGQTMRRFKIYETAESFRISELTDFGNGYAYVPMPKHYSTRDAAVEAVERMTKEGDKDDGIHFAD